MLTSAKINLKKYAFFSGLLLLMAYPAVRSTKEYLIILLVFLASCVNHWMLIAVVRRQSEIAANQVQKNRQLTSLLVIGKLVLVASALSFGVQIMGKRILIPLLIYVLQIVVLYLSFEKQTDVEKGTL
jgi:hypothetical protein